LKEYIDNNFFDEHVIILGNLNDNLSDAPISKVFQMIQDDFENYLFADFNIANANNSEWSCPRWPSHLDHIF
jgi:hypothetical protein